MSGSKLCGVLLDLGGVIYVGDKPLPGALAAVERLRKAGIPVRFVTNTTRSSRKSLLSQLAQIGLHAAEAELLTPSQMARTVLINQALTPYLLIHPGLEEDFADLPGGSRPAVVVGDAADGFTYSALNSAYRKLEEGAAFLALAANRNFKDKDGKLSLDAGPFVKALEYAAERQATILGKPSPDFFALAVQSLGGNPADIVMIGDDAEADIGGAAASGLKAILVKTGKYRPGQEALFNSPAVHVAEDVAEAVNWLLCGGF